MLGISDVNARSAITPIGNIKLTLAVNGHAVVAAPAVTAAVEVAAHALTHCIADVNAVAGCAAASAVTSIDSTHLGTVRRLIDCNEQLSAVGLNQRVDALDGCDVLSLKRNAPCQIIARRSR